MTPAEEAAEVAASPAFAANPAGVISDYTGRAAAAYRHWDRALVPPERLRRFVHVACALVALADNPYVQRGAALDELVETYGDGLAP